jgi:hypothetical protein
LSHRGAEYGAVDPEESKARRASHRQSSIELLRDEGFEIEQKNIQPDCTAAHLVVRGGGRVADFWPGTGKWNIRGETEPDGSTRYRRGVRNLIRKLNRARGR